MPATQEMEDLTPPDQPTISEIILFSSMQTIVSIATKAAEGMEVCSIFKALRWTMKFRSFLTMQVFSAFTYTNLPNFSLAMSQLAPLLIEVDELYFSVDTSSSAPQNLKPQLPEIEIFCFLLALIFLIDQERYDEAKSFCSSSLIYLYSAGYHQSRITDVLGSRIYFYYSYTYELTDSLDKIRGSLLALYEKATLRHDEFGQEIILNLLLRNYLHYNLYDQAEKLRSKAPCFKEFSNTQYCRYLFYLGKIKTIKLEYTEAKESLLHAARRAPLAARGFCIQCNKWAVLVCLLLGEIPERTVFMQKDMKKALTPYFELTNAVRVGDLELFRNVADKYAGTFSSDRTRNLIARLRHNVIRTGLRNISISYFRISLADVAIKLRFDSDNPVADVESIVTKAIRDGAIDATVDHANGCMVSKDTGDVYSTNAPQSAFNSRIAFCLNMHNKLLRSLRIPPQLPQGIGNR